ncbi:MAG: hypothetical protein DRN78_06705, partial [Thermoproteota archaeon]
DDFFKSTSIPFVAGFAIGGVLNVMGTSLVILLKSSPLTVLSEPVGVLVILMVLLPSIKAYLFSSGEVESS